MLKNATYKEKFVLLREWIPSIVEEIKKDLKNEHLKKDWQFAKKYLPGKNVGKVTKEDLVNAYTTALSESEDAEILAEFMANRWLLKNTELYSYFEAKLSQINPNFSEIEEIDPEKSKEIIYGAVAEYGPLRTYLFSVINSVVFPEQIYRDLGKEAKEHQEKEIKEIKENEEARSLDSLKTSYEQQINRLTDKYEKKLNGLQKKYLQDTEALKKQIGHLQRKVNAG